jgi:hypothetical protein
MAMRRALLLCILTFLLAACASRREAVRLDTSRTPPALLMETVRAAGTPLTSFSGRGSVAFESPEASGTIFFTVAVRQSDSVLIRFEGPFGLDVGFLYANRTSFVLYNAMENWYATGSTGKGDFRSVLPIDLTFEEMLGAFTGTFQLPEHRMPSHYSALDNQYLLVFTSVADTSWYWVDPALKAVTQYRVSRGDSCLVEGTTDNWTEEDGRLIPMRVALTFPSSARQVSVFYSSVEINPESLPFSHTVPSKARHRIVQ